MTIGNIPFVVYDSTTFVVAFTGSCTPDQFFMQAGVGQSILSMNAFYPPEQVLIIPGSPDTYQVGAMFSSEGLATCTIFGLPDATTISAPSSWSPTIGSTVGSITSVSAVAPFFWTVGSLTFFELGISVTTIGTGAGALTFTLPTLCNVHTFANIAGFTVDGSSVSQKPVYGAIQTDHRTINVLNYDNTFPLPTNGWEAFISGWYLSQ